MDGWVDGWPSWVGVVGVVGAQERGLHQLFTYMVQQQRSVPEGGVKKQAVGAQQAAPHDHMYLLAVEATRKGPTPTPGADAVAVNGAGCRVQYTAGA